MGSSRRGFCSWVCFTARRAGLRPQFSCSFVDSPLAGRPLFFGTLLLTAVIFAQTVRFQHVLRDLIFQPLPNLPVKCLDRFEVHRQFPSPARLTAGPQVARLCAPSLWKANHFSSQKRPSTGGVAGATPNPLSNQPCSKTRVSAESPRTRFDELCRPPSDQTPVAVPR